MTTLDQVLRLAQQLTPEDQARLRAALAEAEERARAEQLRRNQAAIALLDSWAASDEPDDGDVPWDEMLRSLDQHRESTRLLYPELVSPPDRPA